MSILLAVIIALVVGLVKGGVFDNARAHHKSVDKSIGAGVTATGQLPNNMKATILPQQTAPYKFVQYLSPVINITPRGKLTGSVTLDLPLDRPVATGVKVYVAINTTHQNSDWQVRQGKVSDDGQHVRITTNHLSLWQAFIVDPNKTFDEFQKNVVFALSGADKILIDAKRPSCTGSSSDSDYTISAETKEVLYYCFGTNGSSHVMKVTNRKNYPVNVRFSGMRVTDRGYTNGVFTRLRGFAGDNTVILFPGDTATFAVDLKKGATAWAKTSFSGWAENLYRFDVAMEGLEAVLSGGEASGARAVIKSAKTLKFMDAVLSIEACNSAVEGDDTLHMLLHCLPPDKVVKFFGYTGAAFMLGSVSTVSTLAGWLAGEFNSVVDNIRGKDNALITIGRQATGRQITFHGLTLTVPNSWQKGTVYETRSDVLGIRTGGKCQTVMGTTSCPGFEIHGPSALGQEWPVIDYTGENFWQHGTGVTICPVSSADYPYISGQPTRRYSGQAKVGDVTARYMEWSIPCKSSDFKKGITYIQKLWWLPASKILIVDEWNTPGLADVLKHATWLS